MSAETPAPRPVDFGREQRRPSPLGPDLLHQPTVRRPDFRLTGAGRKARDLVGLLMSHGARVRRAARPRCRIALDVVTPTGVPAVEIWVD